jgi:hypothetical protein
VSRTRAASVGAIVSASLALAACGDGGEQHSSQAVLREFALVPPGIVLELHPDERHIFISADADPPLEVCQVGTSFAGAWLGGCRPLGDQAIALPATNGAIHVVFRVTSTDTSNVDSLILRWHCVDHRFWLHALRSALPRTRPLFDC